MREGCNCCGGEKQRRELGAGVWGAGELRFEIVWSGKFYWEAFESPQMWKRWESRPCRACGDMSQTEETPGLSYSLLACSRPEWLEQRIGTCPINIRVAQRIYQFLPLCVQIDYSGVWDRNALEAMEVNGQGSLSYIRWPQMAMLSDFVKSGHPLSLHSFITDKTTECPLYSHEQTFPTLTLYAWESQEYKPLFQWRT